MISILVMVMVSEYIKYGWNRKWSIKQSIEKRKETGMKALIIYDATGRIWNVTYGEDILPTGLSGMVADVPEGRSVYGIDFSGSIPKARYEELPKTEVEQISGKIDALSESINHLVTGSVMPMTVACSFIAETFTDDQAVQVPGLYPE